MLHLRTAFRNFLMGFDEAEKAGLHETENWTPLLKHIWQVAMLVGLACGFIMGVGTVLILLMVVASL